MYPALSGAVLLSTGNDRLVQINGGNKLVQLWYADEPVSGAGCLAAIGKRYFLWAIFDIYQLICEISIGFRTKLFAPNNFVRFPINNQKIEGNSFQCKKQIPIHSGSAFSFSTNYIAAGSGRLMLPRINPGGNIFFPAHIQIIRLPLHHVLAGVKVLSPVNIRRPHAVALLMAHLPLHGIP